jgi:hypothetical protein
MHIGTDKQIGVMTDASAEATEEEMARPGLD